jgi:hypothetical protein
MADWFKKFESEINNDDDPVKLEDIKKKLQKEKNNLLIKADKVNVSIGNYLEPSDMRLSTMTIYTKCLYEDEKTPVLINDRYVFDNLELSDDILMLELREYNDIGLDIKYRAIRQELLEQKQLENSKKKKKIVTNSVNRKGKFHNQVTVILRQCENETLNVKICKNGSLHITGSKSVSFTEKSLQKLLEKMNLLDVYRDKPLHIDKLNIGLINMDFNLHFRIERDVLNEIFSNEYDLISIFDSANHPAVNTKFLSDYECKQEKHKLVPVKDKYECSCDCKIVCVSTFQTGSVIINSKSFEAIYDIYRKYNAIIKKHYKDIVQKDISFENKNLIRHRKRRKNIQPEEVKMKEEVISLSSISEKDKFPVAMEKTKIILKKDKKIIRIVEE